MEQIRFTQANYVDFNAVRFFIANGVNDATFTTRMVKVDGETVPLVVVGGTLPGGELVNMTLWPRDHASDEVLARLKDGQHLDNVIFRIGYYDTVDKATGEVVTVQGAPKTIRLVMAGDEFTLGGAKREFSEGEQAK